MNILKAIANWFKNLSKTKAEVSAEKAPAVLPFEPIPATPTDVKPIQAVQKGVLWYPRAHVPNMKMKEKGKYANGYPIGAVVHFTAGRSGGLRKALDSIEGGIKDGYTFLCIADSGEIVQANPLNTWGYHAGESAWKGILGTVSDDLVGIEMNNAGKVESVGNGRFKTWFGTYLTADQVRYVTEKDYGCPTGYYHKYTPAQEKTLIEFLVWLKKNDPTGKFKIDYILGHHEVAGKLGIGKWRKNDPGGALSMTMAQLRAKVAELCK